jgi:L-idonate 5-dehydrogenase
VAADRRGEEDVDLGVVFVSEVLGTGKVVLFAVPGAFTPGCSNVHLPGFVERAGELSGKRVLVTGSGPIGALTAAAGAHAGAAEIVVTDLQDAPLAVARAMGATKTVNVAAEPEALEPYYADKGTFDLAFECSAAAPAVASAIKAVRPQGTVVQLGVAGDLPIPVNVLVSKEINLIGSHRFDAEFAEAVRLIDRRAIDVRPVISGSYPLEEAGAAFARAGDRSRAVKIQLTFATC